MPPTVRIADITLKIERWSLTAEFMQEPVESHAFGPMVEARDRTVQGYLLQSTYLMRDDLECVLRYGEGFTDKRDRDGRRQAAATGGLVPPYNFCHKDRMVGLRRDVTPSFMLRTEYQWRRGTWTLSPRENPDPSATLKDWDRFTVLASYRF